MNWLLRGVGALVVLSVLGPLLIVALSWSSDQTEIWQHLIATGLSKLLGNTLILMLGVGVMVTLLGVSLAWLTAMCEFPGRRFFSWALMLPMAMPAYVLAFVTLGLFDFSGPLQQGLRSALGDSWQYIDVRNSATVVVVLSLVLYPYVYLLARSAFLAQSTDTVEAARVLGCSGWQAFWRVALPMARPAIVAGVSLALMETLADFGAVAIFNYDTFTTAIYKAWFGFFSIQAAAQLASLLLLFVGVTLWGERASRGERGFVQGARLQHHFRHPLTAGKAMAASLLCAMVFGVAFLLPVIQMVQWVIELGVAQFDGGFYRLLQNSFSLAAMAAFLTVVIASLLAWNRRQGSLLHRRFVATAQLGYALPGTVLAVGTMLLFTRLEHRLVTPVQQFLGVEPTPLLVGGVGVLLAAYWVRFLAVATGPVESAILRVKPSVPEAARNLGVSGAALVRRVWFPVLRNGLLTAGILVFVDVMKEMPATLLLRPYGWDTLAVRIFELTSEGEWHRAALPGIMIVLLGLVPAIMVMRKTDR